MTGRVVIEDPFDRIALFPGKSAEHMRAAGAEDKRLAQSGTSAR